MQKKFYYLRHQTSEGKIPYACVCIMKTADGSIARGVSVCSSNDSFIKQIGRNKAAGYAMKAIAGCGEIYKRLNIAKQIVDSIVYMPYNQRMPENPTYKFSHGKYLQSSLLKSSVKEVNPDIPITEFEKSLLDDDNKQ